MVSTFFITTMNSFVSGHPPIDQLLIRYYMDNGMNFASGQGEILIETRNPSITKEDFFPPQPPLDPDGNPVDNYQDSLASYYADRYDVNFSQAYPEEKYEAVRLYYSGEKKRKDISRLTPTQYQQVLGDKKAYDTLPFNRYFDDGAKMYSINDQGEILSINPQVIIEHSDLGIPPIHQYGRSRLSEDQAGTIVKWLLSDKYVLSGVETAEGYLVKATKAEDQRGSLTAVEVLFDPRNNYVVKKATKYYDGFLFSEEVFDNYMQTSSGAQIPTIVISRKYAPSFRGSNAEDTSNASNVLLTFEEKVTVLAADFNVDIPDDVLTPDIPYGATVLDTTVSPPLQYTAGKVIMADNTDYYDSTVPTFDDSSVTVPLAAAEAPVDETEVPSGPTEDTPSSPPSSLSRNGLMKGFVLFGVITLVLLLVFVGMQFLMKSKKQ